MSKAYQVGRCPHCRCRLWMPGYSDDSIGDLARVIDGRWSRKFAAGIVGSMADPRRINERRVDIADMDVGVLCEFSSQRLRKSFSPNLLAL